ncbi:MAG TPA: ribonuclease Z [Tenuifilaceae bacterium]|nr:ribonuclease Z [Tenuifilaceae bacterium]HPE17354.1 ribonuclease Z [Tenuifilaceae bacterium]HPJ45824.1 ribonuclease Z [Tenuifilaceae bacterium]HPQ33540.1 ribonuclease Z [Tenuifilaceae bacterium]HRX66828.1 ribonuclease Z [Tenuifilaceae bacterium]
MTFALTILGSSSALPTATRFPSAHALNVHERLFLVDCAEGTQMQLRKYKLKLSRLEHIFISHLHGDHSLGLVGLISTLNLLGRKNDLYIHAHGALEELLRKNIDFFVTDLQYPVHFVHLESKKHKVIYSDKNITVESLPLKHRIPSTGFLFRETPKEPNIKKDLIEKYAIPLSKIVEIKQGANFVTSDGITIPNSELTYISSYPRSYAYCSDTSYYEKLVTFIEGVDVLYHEATFDSSMKKMAKATGHSTALQAATIAAKARVGKLIIGHFSSRYRNVDILLNEARSVFPETYLAEEGNQYSVI